MPSVRIHDCDVAFEDSGPRPAPALVLLHGFLGCKEDWAEARRVLGGRMRVVAVDLPGHGQTRAARFPEDYSVDGACCLLDGLFEHLGLHDVLLVGYSMGGRIALACALQNHVRLRGLVLESAAAGISDPQARRLRIAEDEDRAAALEQGGLAAFVQAWEAQPLFASQAAISNENRERQRNLRLRGNARELAASLRAAGSGAQAPLGDRLSSLAVPVLLLTGSLDTKFVAIAEAMLHALPDARRRSAEGAGHNVHLERPDFFHAALVAFHDDVATTIRPDQGDRP